MSLRSLADEMDAAPHMSGVGHLSPIRGGSVPKSIRATPYRWQSPDTLPRRPWIYGRQLLRGSAFVVIAPGATGKSSLLAGMALSLCTGRPYLGQQVWDRSEEHTSELQSLMRISYAVFCLKKKKTQDRHN